VADGDGQSIARPSPEILAGRGGSLKSRISRIPRLADFDLSVKHIVAQPFLLRASVESGVRRGFASCNDRKALTGV
jgi:hypothetical protein